MTAQDVISLLGALAIIVGVLILTYYASRWYAKRMGGGAAGGGKYIKIYDRAGLGGNASLVIAQVGDRYYLIGVSDKSVELLRELHDFDPAVLDRDRPPQRSFGQIFADALSKNGKAKQQDDDEGGQ